MPNEFEKQVRLPLLTHHLLDSSMQWKPTLLPEMSP